MTQAIAIVGPTAVGKSALADQLAAHFGSAVLSADAMQVYRGMDIGTAKMAPAACRAPLLLVDIVDPDVAYSAACYQHDARAIIDAMIARGQVPVLCGGTGLYIRAALDEMDFPSGEVASDARRAYEALAERLGPDGLHALLAERDPESAAHIHPHNVRRVIRALEMHDEGISYAAQKAGFAHPQARYAYHAYALTMDRERLYDRINRRVDLMFEAGLVDEVAALAHEGFAAALTARQAIGYKEVLDYLAGSISFDEARELIKLRSRRYAKRQLAWFRRDDRITWINCDEFDTAAALAYILDREGL